jgi:hypothetical protein
LIEGIKLLHNEVIEHKITEPEKDGTQKCVFCDVVVTKPRQVAFTPGLIYQYDDEATAFGTEIAAYIIAMPCTKFLEVN